MVLNGREDPGRKGGGQGGGDLGRVGRRGGAMGAVSIWLEHDPNGGAFHLLGEAVGGPGMPVVGEVAGAAER